MSDTARSKSAGELLAAEEVNHDLPIEVTVGESFTGATTPQAAYIKASDSKVWKAVATALGEALDNFVGFIVDTGSADATLSLQKDGVVPGFSGLTPGAHYYVSDTAGNISTTPGTITKLIGVAVSATELAITHIKTPRMAQGVGSRAANLSGSGVGVTTNFRPRMVQITANRGGGSGGSHKWISIGGWANAAQGCSYSNSVNDSVGTDATKSILVKGNSGGGESTVDVTATISVAATSFTINFSATPNDSDTLVYSWFAWE
jgi:hypothetical protein